MLIDKIFAAKLAHLRIHHPEVYCNLKMNTQDICKRLALDKAEEVFNHWQTSTHTFYHVEPAVQRLVAKQMNSVTEDFTEAFFVVTAEQGFGVLFLLDKQEFTVERRSVSGKENVLDILQQFDGYLHVRERREMAS